MSMSLISTPSALAVVAGAAAGWSYTKYGGEVRGGGPYLGILTYLSLMMIYWSIEPKLYPDKENKNKSPSLKRSLFPIT